MYEPFVETPRPTHPHPCLVLGGKMSRTQALASPLPVVKDRACGPVKGSPAHRRSGHQPSSAVASGRLGLPPVRTLRRRDPAPASPLPGLSSFRLRGRVAVCAPCRRSGAGSSGGGWGESWFAPRVQSSHTGLHVSPPLAPYAASPPVVGASLAPSQPARALRREPHDCGACSSSAARASSLRRLFERCGASFKYSAPVRALRRVPHFF